MENRVHQSILIHGASVCVSSLRVRIRLSTGVAGRMDVRNMVPMVHNCSILGALHRLGLHDWTQAKRSSWSLHPSLPPLHGGTDCPRSGVWNQTDSFQKRDACFNHADGLLRGAGSLLLLRQRRVFNPLQPFVFRDYPRNRVGRINRV